MRIGLLAHSGITFDSFFVPLVAQWEKDGHQVSLAAGHPAEKFSIEVLSGITRRPSLLNLRAHRQISEWAAANNVDVIVTSTATASALARFPKLDKPVVYFCHGLHWNTGATIEDRVWMSIEQLLLRNTAAVMCMNSDDFKWFGARFSKGCILYLHKGVGVPLKEFVPSPLPEGDTLSLLWAGEFSPRKRPHLMLEIASILSQRGVKFELQMLGKGRLHNEMIQKVASLGLGSIVSLPGHQPIQDYLRRSHLFVHTSVWEGLPRVMLEARAMRRQSITFDVKGSRDIPDVIRVPDTDTRAFADAIVTEGSRTLGTTYSLAPVAADIDSADVAESISSFMQSVLGQFRHEEPAGK